MPSQFSWLILIFPIFSFLSIAFIFRPFFSRSPKLSGYITILAIGLSWLFSIWAFITVWNSPEHKLAIAPIQILVIEKGINISIGLLMDSLTTVMLLVVTTVSLMVQIYSQGYMHEDPGYPRYFAWMSLFTASMLGLVMSNNLLFLYVFWEGVGLCSYLLMGFWFHKPSAANAAKKAFIVTRLGDFGLLIAILILYFKTGTFDIEALKSYAIAGKIGGTALTLAALGIFSGAAGKSAQFPLHVWLPDAMEGPTPVSALIHAATMVAAGVFLVGRTLPIFEPSRQAITTVAVIGGFTAIFAASMGLVMNDIKRVIAYSTISQLGYMMLGLGTGGVAIGIIHLFNHAFFKALLFLGAGSVNHATGTFDMRQMGGLRKYMPWTSALFFIAALSLAGIWPLAGFWSKDEILAGVFGQNKLLFILALATVPMTAFYIFRAYFLTFGGQNRAQASPGVSSIPHAAADSHYDEGKKAHTVQQKEAGHAFHESPAVMIAPMAFLALLAIVSGLFNVGGALSSFIEGKEEQGVGFFGVFTHPLPWIALILALLGILLAYLIYSKKSVSAESIGRAFSLLYKVFSHKYWMDELYEKVIVEWILYRGLFRLFELIDKYVVDGAVNGIAWLTKGSGEVLRKAQTGKLQVYGMAMFIGLIFIIAGFYLLR